MSGDDTKPSVARFDEAPGFSDQYLDTGLPGHARTVYNVIGTNVGADPEGTASIDPDDFNLAIVEAEPGNGAALHDHETVEVFMPLSGRWEIYYGDDGEESVVLDQWDTVQVPPGVFRGFRNAGDETAHLLALTGGEDPGRVTWPEELLEEAQQGGRTRNEEGYLVDSE
jgi:mannose-6-phosphate isomerase-like protein (cupin superfamily)